MKKTMIFSIILGISGMLSGINYYPNALTTTSISPQNSLPTSTFFSSESYKTIKKDMGLYPLCKGRKFFIKNEVPSELKASLDSQNTSQLTLNYPTAYSDTKMCTPDFLPGYIIKEEPCAVISRVQGSLELQKVIDQNNLYLLGTPKKYLYRIPSSTKHNELVYNVSSKTYEMIDPQQPASYLTVVQKINAAQGTQVITREQLDQLKILIKKTGYFDLHQGNIIMDEKGKLFIIDTEKRSFRQLPISLVFERFVSFTIPPGRHQSFIITQDHTNDIIQQTEKAIPIYP